MSVEDWAEIRRLHRSEGMPIKAIARVMGVGRNTVRRALAAEGSPADRQARLQTKREAALFAATVEVAKAKGEYVASSLARIPVGELAADWLARKQQATAPSHYRMLDSSWRVHVARRWAAESVSDIDQLGVEAWITDTKHCVAG